MKKNKAEWFKPALFTLQNHSVCTFTAGYTFPNLIAPFFPAGVADNQIYVWRNEMFSVKKTQMLYFKKEHHHDIVSLSVLREAECFPLLLKLSQLPESPSWDLSYWG